MTGHVRRRGERSWEIKFEVGRDPGTGKRITKYHSFRGTKRDAEAELVRLKASSNGGTYIDLNKVTVGEFFERWERDWAASNLSPKTLERFAELIVSNIRPEIGSLPIQKLKPVHLAGLYAKLLREGRKRGGGLSPRTVGQVHRILHRALGHALKWGLITINPCAAVEPPLVASTEIEVLTEEQVQEVLQKLRGRPMYTLATLGLSTGMRRGELLALRWRDVDLDACTIRVEQSLEQTKAGLRFKEPKTRHGRRKLALPASVAVELRGYRRKQQEQRLALGLGKDDPDALVFRRISGDPIRPDNVSSEWRRLVRVLKLPKVTLHAWRHTHASQLIALGMDVLTISRRLGHGSPSITLNVYSHMLPGSDDRAAQRIDASFSRALKD